jgi:[protein-PII] uridylyltransferase
LGLGEAETRTLIFLVEQHLSLSKVSNRRDTGDGSLLKEMAEKIQTRARLDLLYLLTCADSTAVGQGSFPMWKDELLGELYMQLAAVLDPDEASPAAQRASLLEKLTATAASESERDQAWMHCERVPPRYLVEVSVEEARLHLRLVAKLKDENREAVAAIQGDGDLVDVWVATTDRPRRFAQICGAFLGAGVNVVSAIAYTRSDGLILDHFRVSLSPAFGVPTGEARATFWERVAREVEGALEGLGGFLQKLENARRRIPRVPLISRHVEPEVRLDNQVSERYTVIDVVCGDRIGLLYGLARAIGDLNCDIHFAKIDTQQGLATDVFYVTEVGGAQVLDPEKANNIRLLLRAVADEFQEARR